MTRSERTGPASRARYAGEARRVGLSLVGMAALVLVARWLKPADPGALLVAGAAAFTSLYGYPSGIACAAAALIYALVAYPAGQGFTAENIQRIVLLALGAAGAVASVGRLYKKYHQADERLADGSQLARTDDAPLGDASVTDALTGARNRFAIRRDYSRYERKRVHVMMLDIDDFKRVNDTYGHPVGDYILKKLGQILNGAFGAESCYRYGGDEFLVVRADTEDSAFRALVERALRESAAIRLNDKPLPVRLSAGYVSGVCELSCDLRLMMHQADHDLYVAKSRGKNQYVGEAYDRETARSLEKSFHNDERHMDIL